jgi:Uma2 family endonuclease
MSLPARKEQYLPHYTYEDYCLWEGRWELIFGIPYAMTPAPMITHQSISALIAAQLVNVLVNCNKCQTLLPVDWKIADDTIVQPDNLVVCYETEGAYITKAPSLIFEIVSKSSVLRDTEIKFQLYEQEGVNYYCLVFPEDKFVKLYLWEKGSYIKIGDFTDEKIDMSLTQDCAFQFDFSQIWSK